MFRSKTLFVVGAGASSEVGLPIGRTLKSTIATKIDIRFDDWGQKQISGDYTITEALRVHASKTASRDINPYLHAAWKIRDAMPQAISIDNYIDTHRDPTMELCGKLTIAQSILEAERSSHLYFNPHDGKLEYSAIDGTWYASFFQLLSEGIRKDSLRTIFENASFIVFNYDRCLEHYLIYAIQNYYDVEEDTAKETLSQLKIFHPYGVVGALPWQDRRGIAFGAKINGTRLLEISQNIRTFTEQFDDADSLNEMRKCVQEAERIVFLGFAFHELNMKLISPRGASRCKRVFATALNISTSDCNAITNDILSLIRRNKRHGGVEIRNDRKCGEMIEEYRRTLSR